MAEGNSVPVKNNSTMWVVAVVAGITLLLGIVGAVVLPIRESIKATNDRIDRERASLFREIEVIQREINALDDKLQIEDGTLRVEIQSADAISLERHSNQGLEFRNSIDAADGKLQAEISLVSSQTAIRIAELDGRLNSLRELFDFVVAGDVLDDR